jgi:hypothetical protein
MERDRGCGPSTFDCFAFFDPGTCSWRTSQGSLLEGWVEFSETWPPSGSMRSGSASALPSPQVPFTIDSECSYWPTPTKSDPGVPWVRGEASHAGQGLAEAVFRAEGLLTDQPSGQREWGGTLVNPAWVVWLMGFPMGWLDDSSPR